jgi:hypothetical protein
MLDSKAEYVTKSQGLEDKSDLITRRCQGLAFSGVDGQVYTVWTFVCWGRCLFYISQAWRRQSLWFGIFSHLDMTAGEDTGGHGCCRLWASWDGGGITGKSVTGLGA